MLPAAEHAEVLLLLLRVEWRQVGRCDEVFAIHAWITAFFLLQSPSPR